MALTPEQVLNRQFQTTQFRKGYDERDVDDFLDEIVTEMRSLQGQRDELTVQLDNCLAGRDVQVPSRPDTAKVSAELEVAQRQLAEARAQLQRAQSEGNEAKQELAQARTQLQTATAQPDKTPGTPPQGSPQPAAGPSAVEIIELAQRVHDEHIAKGRARHDELVSTAQQQHDTLLAQARAERERLLSEAQSRSTGLLAEAQDKRTAVLGGLEHEQSSLQQKIEQLRTSERSYRGELRSMLEDKLSELDTSATKVTGAPA